MSTSYQTEFHFSVCFFSHSQLISMIIYWSPLIVTYPPYKNSETNLVFTVDVLGLKIEETAIPQTKAHRLALTGRAADVVGGKKIYSQENKKWMKQFPQPSASCEAKSVKLLDLRLLDGQDTPARSEKDLITGQKCAFFLMCGGTQRDWITSGFLTEQPTWITAQQTS